MGNQNRRIAALQAKLNEQGLAGALYAVSANFVYLLEADTYDWQRLSYTNIGDHMANPEPLAEIEALLLVPAEGEATVLATPRKAAGLERSGVTVTATPFDRFDVALQKLLPTGAKVAVGGRGGHFLSWVLGEAKRDIVTIPGEMLTAELRMFKTPAEIARLEKAAKLTDDAMGAILEQIKTGVTAHEIENFFIEYGLSHGASDTSFSPTCCFVQTGHPTAQDNMGRSKYEPLVPGCGAAFDLGYVVDGYCSDFGRSFYYGETPERLHKAYESLQGGQLNMIKNIRPGKTNIKQLYDYVKEVVEGAGFPLRFPERGSLGHQIGIDCHEHPMLNYTVDFVLQPGMVFASEPKIWLPGEVYLRVEDMILVTEDGARPLTVFDRTRFALPVR